ncbi:MAG: T9SS type A sorting domain-containing protein [Bacteroidetes bacterium]|nr:T9SS type A sorting domain-containing protein [Bacteroidota bacterium]
MILFILLFANCLCYSQTIFQKTYLDSCRGYKIIETYNNEFIALGDIDKYIRTDTVIDTIGPIDTFIYRVVTKDVLVIKTNFQGDTIWTKEYGGVNYEYAQSIIQTRDSNFIILATDSSYNLWVFKIDSNGNKIWEKTYTDILPGDIQLCKDGYLITGHTSHIPSGQTDIFLLKINNLGDSVWYRNYGDSIKSERGISLMQTQDSGYLVLGSSTRKMHILKTDSLGNVLWQKETIEDAGFFPINAVSTFDNGYLILYNYGETPILNIEPRLLKLNSKGDSLWTTSYFDYNLYDRGYSLITTTDSAFVISGGMNGNVSPNNQIFLIKVDSLGNVLWQNLYYFGGQYFDFAKSVFHTSDNGYVLTGYSATRKLFIIKTDQSGHMKIENPSPPDNPVFIFPIPTSDRIYIKNLDPLINEMAIEIIDINGKSMIQDTIESDSDYISVKSLKSGIYFCIVSTNSYKTYHKIIISK